MKRVETEYIIHWPAVTIKYLARKRSGLMALKDFATVDALKLHLG